MKAKTRKAIMERKEFLNNRKKDLTDSKDCVKLVEGLGYRLTKTFIGKISKEEGDRQHNGISIKRGGVKQEKDLYAYVKPRFSSIKKNKTVSKNQFDLGQKIPYNKK